MHRRTQSTWRTSTRWAKKQEEREAEAVEVILNDQLRVSSEVELKRADGFRQRASWLLGFSGVILGLGASQADELLKDTRELGSFGHIFAPVALGLAFLSVAAAASWSLWVLFLGKRGVPEFSEREIKDALSDDFLCKGKAFNQIRIAEATQSQILARRSINRRSNSLLIKAFVALLVALVLFVAQAGVMLENTVEGHACPYATLREPLALVGGSQITSVTLESYNPSSQRIVLERPKCPPSLEPVPE